MRFFCCSEFWNGVFHSREKCLRIISLQIEYEHKHLYFRRVIYPTNVSLLFRLSLYFKKEKVHRHISVDPRPSGWIMSTKKGQHMHCLCMNEELTPSGQSTKRKQKHLQNRTRSEIFISKFFLNKPLFLNLLEWVPRTNTLQSPSQPQRDKCVTYNRNPERVRPMGLADAGDVKEKYLL